MKCLAYTKQPFFEENISSKQQLIMYFYGESVKNAP